MTHYALINPRAFRALAASHRAYGFIDTEFDCGFSVGVAIKINRPNGGVFRDAVRVRRSDRAYDDCAREGRIALSRKHRRKLKRYTRLWEREAA